MRPLPHILRILLAALAIALPMRAHAADTKPPVIKHTPVKTAVRGETLVITAQMKDESEIFGATLWYRPAGTSTYQSAEMVRKTEDVWGAAIPASGNIEYWIEAYDEFGNGPSRAGKPEKPFLVKVTEQAPIYAMPTPKEEEPAPALVVPAAAEPITVPLPASEAPAAAAPEKKVEEPPAPTEAAAPEATAEKPAEAAADKPVEAAADAPVDKKKDSMDDLSAPPPTSAFATQPDFIKPQEPVDTTPVYQRWWFITGVSVVGVAAITAAVILLQPQPVYRNVFGASLQPQ